MDQPGFSSPDRFSQVLYRCCIDPECIIRVSLRLVNEIVSSAVDDPVGLIVDNKIINGFSIGDIQIVSIRKNKFISRIVSGLCLYFASKLT